MGNIYKTPPDTNEKEKIIGGFITFQQAMYLAAGFGLGALSFLLFSLLINFYLGIILFFVCTLTIGPLLAFYKIDGYTLDKHLYLSYLHKKKGKKLPYMKVGE